jgi:hypothetical protein
VVIRTYACVVICSRARVSWHQWEQSQSIDICPYVQSGSNPFKLSVTNFERNNLIATSNRAINPSIQPFDSVVHARLSCRFQNIDSCLTARKRSSILQPDVKCRCCLFCMYLYFLRNGYSGNGKCRCRPHVLTRVLVENCGAELGFFFDRPQHLHVTY